MSIASSGLQKNSMVLVSAIEVSPTEQLGLTVLNDEDTALRHISPVADGEQAGDGGLQGAAVQDLDVLLY